MIDACTIVAAASPPGRSMRGLLRLSGRGLGAMASRWLGVDLPDRACVAALVPVAGGWRRHQSVMASGRALAGPEPDVGLAPPPLTAASGVRGLVTRFGGPRSFTGEDIVEILLPGNPELLSRVIDGAIIGLAALGLHVRRAGPGEFTARAFLNSRMDLVQAEGVALAVAASSDAELRAARSLLSGALGGAVVGWSETLIEALALVEAGIDFTDQEDVVAITAGALRSRMRGVQEAINRALAAADGAEPARPLPRVVIEGPPNAGKSSLFNALLGRRRTIISDVAGTTRDAIVEHLRLPLPHGVLEIVLVDLPGIDVSSSAELDRSMHRVAIGAAREADLVLRCHPAASAQAPPIDTGAPQRPPIIDVATRCDLIAGLPPAAPPRSVRTSAHTGEGLAALREAMAASLSRGASSTGADRLAVTERAKGALAAAAESLAETAALIDHGRDDGPVIRSELVAEALRRALDHLGEVSGRVAADDVLARVFSRFCVGK